MKIDEADLKGAIGQVLANTRAARDLGQSVAAEKAGIDQSSLSKLESGAVFPGWPLLLKLCRLYRVDPAEIVTVAQELLNAKEGTQVSQLEPDEHALLTLYRECTAEGKRLMLDRAKAVRTLFPK